MIKSLPNPESLFTSNPEGGAVKEGRAGMSGGTFMDIGSLVLSQHCYDFVRGQKEYEFSSVPFQTYEFMSEIRTFIPIDVIAKGKPEDRQDILVNVGRLEANAWWQLSWQEIIRHILRMKAIEQTEFFQKCKKIAEYYQDEIHQLLIDYLRKIESLGDWSYEQFEYYAKEHEGSTSPWGVKWKELVKNERLCREAWSDICQKLHKFISEYDSLVQKFKRPLVKGDKIYPALRHRMAEYTVIQSNRKSLLIKCITAFCRKAGGIYILSQVEFPIYGKHDIKSKVYEHFYDWIKKVLGITNDDMIKSISIDGMEFYKELLTGKWECADISNAEKQVAQILWKTLFNADLTIPQYGSDSPGEMNSGIGPTKPLNELVVTIMILVLKDEYGLTFTMILFGGDNFALKDCNLEEINRTIDQKSFGIEERVLGMNPEKKCFWPTNLITDNPKHAHNLPGSCRELKQVQTREYELRPLQTVVQCNLYLGNSCEVFIKWACENDEFKEAIILDRNHFEDIITNNEHLRINFLDKFSDELNWLSSYVPVHQNVNETTNLRVQVF